MSETSVTAPVIQASFSPELDAQAEYVRLLRVTELCPANVTSFRHLCAKLGKSAVDAAVDFDALVESDRLEVLAETEPAIAEELQAVENELQMAVVILEDAEAVTPGEGMDQNDIDAAIRNAEKACDTAAVLLCEVRGRHGDAKAAGRDLAGLRIGHRGLFPLKSG